jgi:hypothetical protein
MGKPIGGPGDSGTGDDALDFNASPIFKASKLYMTNMSATDGGVNSKVSILHTPFRGSPLLNLLAHHLVDGAFGKVTRKRQS